MYKTPKKMTRYTSFFLTTFEKSAVCFAGKPADYTYMHRSSGDKE
jgi:hypothetical protein